MALTNLNTDSNSELIDLLLKMLSASHQLQNKIQISLPSFQGFPTSDPNLHFCGYFLRLSPGKLYPAKLKLSVLSTHRWYFLSSICSYNPLYLNVPPDIWKSESHFSGLPTKKFHSPFPISNNAFILGAVSQNSPIKLNTQEKSSLISNFRDEPWFFSAIMQISSSWA